jgi:hypothetical protein
MEALVWNLRTTSGFLLGAPVCAALAFALLMFSEYPLLLPMLLLRRVISGRRWRQQPAQPLAMLVVIPSLLRKAHELASMKSTIHSVATNGYPGELVIVVSIDGCSEAPALYADLCRWAAAQCWNDQTWLHVTGTPLRRSKPMAIDHALHFVQELVHRGVHPEIPPLYVSTDADADLGARSLEHLASRLQRLHPITRAPARAVAGALYVRGDEIWKGWRHFFSVRGQLNLQVARDYYVSNNGRFNLRWLPITGVPGALYCTWTEIFLAIPRFMGYTQHAAQSALVGLVARYRPAQV